MKSKIIIILLATIFTTLADEKIESLTTLEGRTYTSITVTKHTESALHFMHSSGVAVVPLAKLPKELQDKYDYDPIKAAEHKKKKAIEDAKKRKRRSIEQAKYNKLIAAKKAGNAEIEKKKKTHKELLKKAKKNEFFVRQVLKNGLLVNNVKLRVTGGSSLSAIGGGGGGGGRVIKSIGSGIYFVEGYPDMANMVDGKYFKGVFYENGSYSYIDTLGAKRTVKKYVYLETKNK